MTNEEAIRHLEDLQRLYLGNEKFTADIEAIGIAIKALEQQPCEDCISRQAVLDLIDSNWKYEGLETDVASLSSVTPKAERYGRIAGMKKEHDGCVSCRFEDKEEHEEPCRRCSHNYVDKWRAKE